VDDDGCGIDFVECADVVVVFGLDFEFVEPAKVVGLVTEDEVRVGMRGDAVGVVKAFVPDGIVDAVAAEKTMPTSDAKMARRSDILEAILDAGVKTVFSSRRTESKGSLSI
jgi:hypothetical protein